MKDYNPIKIIKNGLFDENPIFVQVVGMCPTLAVTTSMKDGLAMGIATMFVLIGSNVVISMIKSIVPDDVRIPAYVVVIASFTTIIELLLKAYLPSVNATLGVYIPLIVVNCIILARAESFASKNTVVASLFDGIGMGLGFTLALVVMGFFRELIGAGTVFGKEVLPSFIPRISIMITPPGAFFTLGCLIAGITAFKARKAAK